jgi:hypothetical protein
MVIFVACEFYDYSSQSKPFLTAQAALTSRGAAASTDPWQFQAVYITSHVIVACEFHVRSKCFSTAQGVAPLQAAASVLFHAVKIMSHVIYCGLRIY